MADLRHLHIVVELCQTCQEELLRTQMLVGMSNDLARIAVLKLTTTLFGYLCVGWTTLSWPFSEEGRRQRHEQWRPATPWKLRSEAKRAFVTRCIRVPCSYAGRGQTQWNGLHMLVWRNEAKPIIARQ